MGELVSQDRTSMLQMIQWATSSDLSYGSLVACRGTLLGIVLTQHPNYSSCLSLGPKWLLIVALWLDVGTLGRALTSTISTPLWSELRFFYHGIGFMEASIWAARRRSSCLLCHTYAAGPVLIWM